MLKLIQLILLFFVGQSFALSKVGEGTLKKFLKAEDNYSRTNLKYLKEGRLISNSEVLEAPKGKHRAWAKALGLHDLKCESVLPKISRYEDYKKYMSFVNQSTYVNKIFTLAFKVALLPVEFSAQLKIDRIPGQGNFPFVFIGELFKGSAGEIKVQEIEGRCLVYIHLNLNVRDLGYPDFIMENFYTTVAKMGLRKLFQVSGHRMET